MPIKTSWHNFIKSYIMCVYNTKQVNIIVVITVTGHTIRSPWSLSPRVTTEQSRTHNCSRALAGSRQTDYMAPCTERVCWQDVSPRPGHWDGGVVFTGWPLLPTQLWPRPRSSGLRMSTVTWGVNTGTPPASIPAPGCPGPRSRSSTW